MRISNWVFQTAEAMLIGIMSLCGTITLASSKLFTSFQQSIKLHVPGVVSHITLIVGVVLFIIGVFLIMVKNRGRGFFAVLVMLLSFPSILSFDSLDLLKLFKLDSIGAKFTTSLNSVEMTVLAVIIITCYLLINFTSLLRKSRNDLSKQGADIARTGEVYLKSHLVLLQMTAIALTIAAFIMVFALGIESISHVAVARLQWGLFFVGLGCVLLIIGSIYWITSRRKC
jgi:uncharacterized membrane protein YiaA